MDNSWVFVGIYVKRKANLTNGVASYGETMTGVKMPKEMLLWHEKPQK